MRPTLPLDIGPVHFVGIGGIGMSGIAEVLHNLGYKVQGSDMVVNANVTRLRDLGIPVFEGHAGENLGEAGAVVVSSAVAALKPFLTMGLLCFGVLGALWHGNTGRPILASLNAALASVPIDATFIPEPSTSWRSRSPVRCVLW